MAELELHTESESADPFGKKIGILASVIAVFLAVVTIVSHRAHTEAVLLKSDANDKWAYYQAKKIKFHSLELGEDLVNVLGNKSPEAQKMLDKYGAGIRKSTRTIPTWRSRPPRIRMPRRSMWRLARCATISAKACSRSDWC